MKIMLIDVVDSWKTKDVPGVYTIYAQLYHNSSIDTEEYNESLKFTIESNLKGKDETFGLDTMSDVKSHYEEYNNGVISMPSDELIEKALTNLKSRIDSLQSLYDKNK